MRLFDRFNNKIGELTKIKDLMRREMLNKEYLISFTALQHEPYFDEIEEEAFIELDGQLFIIKKCNPARRGKAITKSVEADHIVNTLIDYYLDSYIDFQAVTSIATLMNLIVADTPFSYTLSGVFEDKDVFDFGEFNKLEGLNYVKGLYQAELEFDTYMIILSNQRGADNGATFEYGKNMRNVERNIDSSNLITRLYGYGKDGLTIEGWNGHTTKYIDSQYINNYSYVKEGKFTDNAIEDQQELYEAMTKHLEKNEIPYVSYRVDVIELKRFNQPGQAFKVGDTITVIDTVLGFDITARVVEYVEYPKEPNRSSVVLANFQDSAADYLAELDDTKRIVDKLFQNGKVQSKFLESFITNASTKLNNAFSEIDIDEFGIIATSKSDPNKLVRFNAEGVGISTDGGQTYRQAMTGDGINADVIVSGHVLFNYIQSLDGHVIGDDNGLKVVDDNGVERLKIGQYADGKYGLLLRNKANDTTILDGDGMLQTWQIAPGAENFDDTNPFNIGLYIPSDVIDIKDIRLSFKLQNFRAYSKGAASDGGISKTSESSSTTTTAAGGSSSETTEEKGLHRHLVVIDNNNGYPISTPSGHSSRWFQGAGDPNNAFPMKILLDASSTGGGKLYTQEADGLHYHSVDIPDHVHPMNHYHIVNFPDHEHGINYGIYQDANGTGPLGIKVDGVDKTSVLGGPFNSDTFDLDLAQFITTGGHHNIEIFLQNPGLGRIDPYIFVQVKVAT